VSRAFVKEDDSGGIEPLPDRTISPDVSAKIAAWLKALPAK